MTWYMRQEIAQAYIERTVSRYAGERVMTGQRTGHYKGQWGSLLKLHLGSDSPKQGKIGLAVSGADGVIWDGDEQVTGNAGEAWLNDILTASGERAWRIRLPAICPDSTR